jgi:hypothetical protein
MDVYTNVYLYESVIPTKADQDGFSRAVKEAYHCFYMYVCVYIQIFM